MIEDVVMRFQRPVPPKFYRPTLITPEELRNIRARLGLSQAMLATWLGVDTRSVNRWERGEGPIRQPGALRFALETLETMTAEALARPPKHRDARCVTPATLRERRLKLGLTQLQLAELFTIGPISDSAAVGVSRMEGGYYDIAFPRMIHLALDRLEHPSRQFRPPRPSSLFKRPKKVHHFTLSPDAGEDE